MTSHTDIFLSWPPGRKTLRKLGQKKFRQLTECYLLEGTSAILDAVHAGASLLGVVYDNKISDQNNTRGIIEDINNLQIPTLEIEENLLRTMSGLDSPPSIIAVMRKPEQMQIDFPLKPGLIPVLDRVNDPGNVGTIIRSAVFYGITEMWLGDETAELYNPKTLRASMAAHLHLKICSSVKLPEMLELAKRNGSTIVATVKKGGNKPEYIGESNKSVLLLLGNEAHGLSEELVKLADLSFAIPGSELVDSLNVAMAATVLFDRILRR